MFRWIPKAAIIEIHKELILEHGGLQGAIAIRHELLDSTLARPKQLEAYSNQVNIFVLAASYGFGFAKNHCFSDGNKRIALVSIDVCLQLNGYELTAEEVEAATVIEDLAAGKILEKELTVWIEENSIRQ